MPRIPSDLIIRAGRIHPLLPLLLRPCRDLKSAQLELKWLHEHVAKQSKLHRSSPAASGIEPRSHWMTDELFKLVRARQRGVPLQYILGTEFFGGLELECRPGVLIPRQTTADMVLNLLDRIRKAALAGRIFPRKMKILDLCSGSGCISLLTAHAFPFSETGVSELHITAADIAPAAISLAKRNQKKVLDQMVLGRADTRALWAIKSIQFKLLDIFQTPNEIESQTFDVVLSNPPYVSPQEYRTVTAHSVRRYEPKVALVPPLQHPDFINEAQADLFYPHISSIAQSVGANILLVEVGSLQQAQRVALRLGEENAWHHFEIWRDDPREWTAENHGGAAPDIKVVGSGDGRSVICVKQKAKSWVLA